MGEKDPFQNGNKPVNQFTRDTMAQNDHDKLVEYGVLLKTIVEGQSRLEQQIKDLINGQASALSSWEITSKAIHDTQDMRLRKLEDLATVYAPKADDIEKRVILLEAGMLTIRDKKNEFLGGWKTVAFIASLIAGALGIIFALANVLAPHTVTISK